MLIVYCTRVYCFSGKSVIIMTIALFVILIIMVAIDFHAARANSEFERIVATRLSARNGIKGEAGARKPGKHKKGQSRISSLSSSSSIDASKHRNKPFQSIRLLQHIEETPLINLQRN